MSEGRTDQKRGFHTRAAKTYADRGEGRPLSIPILQATNFEIGSSETLGKMFHRRDERVYARLGQPTGAAAGKKIASLEGAEAALVFSSGMAAITTSLLTLLRSGDHVVAQREIFAQTFTFLDGTARSLGISTDFVDAAEPERVVEALRPETALIYIETPSNPLLRVIDIEAIARIARQRGIPLLVDSTFASPYLQRPLSLGATLVLHSGTKYLGGHSDVLCGVAAGDAELIRRVRETQILLGGVMDPHASWLLLRGLATLGIRVQRQCDTALELARTLEGQDGVEQVHYPFLETSPFHDRAVAQMRGGGGVLSFEVSGGLEGARAFLNALQIIPIATSLGGVETVIEIPYELDFHEREMGEAAGETGIAPGLVRLAVGIEDADDLRRDLERGLHAARGVTGAERRSEHVG